MAPPSSASPVVACRGGSFRLTHPDSHESAPSPRVPYPPVHTHHPLLPPPPQEAAAAWLAAAKLAPDDGSEEAAWGLYNEQGAMPPALRRRVSPDRCLRLAAALEHEHAVAELSLRQSRKRESRSADGRPDADGRKRERFTRESLNKARAWTERGERAEAYLDQLMGG